MAAKRPARASLRYAKAPLSPRYRRELHQLAGHCSTLRAGASTPIEIRGDRARILPAPSTFLRDFQMVRCGVVDHVKGHGGLGCQWVGAVLDYKSKRAAPSKRNAPSIYPDTVTKRPHQDDLPPCTTRSHQILGFRSALLAEHYAFARPAVSTCAGLSGLVCGNIFLSLIFLLVSVWEISNRTNRRFPEARLNDRLGFAVFFT